MNRRAVLKGLATAAALPLAGALPSRVSAAPLDTVVKKGRLRVAVYTDFAPWSWRRDDKLVGADVDLAFLLAAALGVRVEFFELPADENVEDDLRNAVWKGPITGGEVADVMLHVPVDKEFALRNPNAVIFGPYHRERFALACDPEKVDCTGPVTELAGTRIGVEIDSVPDFYLTGSFGGRLRGDVNHFPTGEKAVEALRKGEVASVMASHTQIEHGLGDAARKFKLVGGPFPGLFRPSWDIGMAVKEDSRDLAYKLEDVVNALSRDGKLAEVFSKYGMTHTPAVSG